MKISDRDPHLVVAARILRLKGFAYYDIGLRVGVSEKTIATWFGPGDRSKCKPAKKHGVHYVSGRRGGQ